MDITTRIQADIDANAVKLYMKGYPESPMCGFSNMVIEILKNYDVPFGSSNILEDPELRQGLKDFFDWPTFPMLVVKGELVGGCDILMEMHQNGELKTVLESSK